MAVTNPRISGRYKIDDISVPDPNLDPETGFYEWEFIGIQFDDYKGTFHQLPIAQKDKYFWSYTYIRAADMKIIEDIVKPKLNAAKSFYDAYIVGGNPEDLLKSKNANSFSVRTLTPDRGWVTNVCYLGTPIRYKLLASDREGNPMIYRVDYHWIQIEGSMVLPGYVPPETPAP